MPRVRNILSTAASPVPRTWLPLPSPMTGRLASSDFAVGVGVPTITAPITTMSSHAMSRYSSTHLSPIVLGGGTRPEVAGQMPDGVQCTLACAARSAPAFIQQAACHAVRVAPANSAEEHAIVASRY